VDAANVDLQLVVANASFRNSQHGVTDKAVQLQALDEAIGSYMAVLKNDTWHPDAAVQLRIPAAAAHGNRAGKRQARLRRRKRPTTSASRAAPAQNSSTKKFEIYIPLEGSERTESGEAGKGRPIQKKGGGDSVRQDLRSTQHAARARHCTCGCCWCRRDAFVLWISQLMRRRADVRRLARTDGAGARALRSLGRPGLLAVR
jgi:hypothetical protein